MFHPHGPTLRELARQALSSTERGYDLLAPKFDLTPFRTPDVVLGALSEYIATELDSKRLLDLCCGTGAVGNALAGVVDVVGLDLSLGMLHEAKRTGQKVVRADATSPPFRQSFDLITCLGALGHFLPHEQRALVAAADTCLEPGGHFLFVTAAKPSALSLRYWALFGFDLLMAVRNFLWSPPFVMFYLRSDLTQWIHHLESVGFTVSTRSAVMERFVLVDAEKPGLERIEFDA